jgi:diaminohydroxyphosphoribosylaminopyrimidine deaminase / 5-amino-6-(5-phosphoribosylamino)uracil reductase
MNFRSFLMDQDEQLMQRALRLAQQACGHTSPNPVVGAVIVHNGRIVGEGYHQRAGSAHAEAAALAVAGPAARGATMYVTLEPCNHYGLTPPCTEAIIQAGVAEVVYAVADPNPHVTGGGHQRLAEAGVRVRRGVCEAEARRQNRFFFHYASQGRPHVIAKFATSLDGKIATRSGHSQWITGAPARARSHELRQTVDAILVGANTVIADDPQLTTRLSRPDARHPRRIVLDSCGRIPLTARLLQPDLPGQTIVAATTAIPPARRAALEEQGVAVVMLPPTGDGRVNLAALLDWLGDQRLTSLLVEGGGQTLGSFFDAGLVNETWAFLAPLVIGGQTAPGPVAGCGANLLSAAHTLENVAVEQLGADILIRGTVLTAAPAAQP